MVSESTLAQRCQKTITKRTDPFQIVNRFLPDCLRPGGKAIVIKQFKKNCIWHKGSDTGDNNLALRIDMQLLITTNVPIGIGGPDPLDQIVQAQYQGAGERSTRTGHCRPSTL